MLVTGLHPPHDQRVPIAARRVFPEMTPILQALFPMARLWLSRQPIRRCRSVIR